MRTCLWRDAVALISMAVVACASGPEGWVPARWQGGPLEVVRLTAAKHPLEAALARAIRDWYDPQTLDLLEDTPINCLLVTWSAGAEPAVELEQHKLLQPYIRTAHQRGIAVVGLIYPGAEAEEAAASAAESGLDALAIEGDFADGPQFARELRRWLRANKSSAVVIPLGARDWLSSDADWPVLGTGDGVTPRVRVFSESGSITATPSSEPWIDSNTWLVRSLQAEAGERPVWLGHRLKNPVEADYLRAVADAAIAGGRWVLAADDRLVVGLWQRDPGALATGSRIANLLSFYKQHAEWSRFAPVAVLGIIQDRGSRHAEVAAENLNLITRRRIPYRVIARDALSAEALQGLQAVLATDLDAPTERERKVLEGFSAGGGLLVAGPSWNSGAPGKEDTTVVKLGAGRLVVYESLPDPESLSKDILDLIGAENFPVRLFNVSSMLGHISADPEGGGLLVQLVDYATEPSERITVQTACGYRRARLFRPEAPPAELTVNKFGEKVEVLIEKVSVYAALLLEK